MEPYINSENLSSKTQSWLKTIEPFNQHRLKLSKEKSALMVIDMQKFFLDSTSPTFTCGGIPIIPNIKNLLNEFRKAERPIIYTKHVHNSSLNDAGIMEWWWEGMCIEGSPESEVHDDIAPIAGEKVILKHRYSAFYNTDLETVLRVLKIEDLVITGIMSNMCCESTARDAYFRDYKVHFLADASGSVTEEMHLATLLNLGFGFANITTTENILKQMK